MTIELSESQNLLLALAALFSMAPVTLAAWRGVEADSLTARVVLIAAAAGPLTFVAIHNFGAWDVHIYSALWITVGVTLLLFSTLCAFVPKAWRLTPLLGPYLLVIGAVATLGMTMPGQMSARLPWSGGIGFHIVISVATYGLVTLSAVAALAAVIQERALKQKAPTALSRRLPSVADCEALEHRLLAAGEIVLAIGLVSGMALLYADQGRFLQLDHKTTLSLAAFVLIGGLLAVQRLTGMRGRVVARVVLVAYLLLTLGYPGVKFVSGVLLA